MLASRRDRGKKGRFGSLSEKNYYEMKKRAEERANRKKKKEDAKKPDKKPTVKKATASKSKDKLTAAQIKAKLDRANRDNKRGLTKAEARAMGLTAASRTSTTKSKEPISPREAAAKLRADRAKQKAARDKEAVRKAAEKKKMKAVDDTVTVASLAVPGAAVVRAGGRGLVTAAKKAGFNNVRDYKKYLAALNPKNVDSTGRRSPINLKRPDKPSGAKDTRKNQLNTKLSNTVLNTPVLGSRVARRLAQQQKAKEARIAAQKAKEAKAKERDLTIRDLGMYGAKKGGLVKKRSIDGIAKRGKTKLKRVKG